MEKSNFIELLQRNSPKEILDFIKNKGKEPKSIDPLIFYEIETPPKLGTSEK